MENESFAAHFLIYLRDVWAPAHPNTKIKPAKAYPDPQAAPLTTWMPFKIFRPEGQLFWYIEETLKSGSRYVSVGFAMQKPGSEAVFAKLQAKESHLEQVLGWPVNWQQPTPTDKRWYISMVNRDIDPCDRNQRNDACKWICTRLEIAADGFKREL